MINFELIGFQDVQDAIQQELEGLRSNRMVTVGIHEDVGDAESSDLTMASLGAIHEFGADIDHPGGTSYGYASKAAADRDEVRFLRKGSGYMELGVTQPHKIKIPARPWLQPGVESATQDILDTIADGIEDGQHPDQVLDAVGVVAAGAVKVYMTELRTPPNAPSTIRQKGSDNPLIDTGALRASVNYEVVPAVGVQEGLE